MKKKIITWIPSIVTVLAAIVTCALYAHNGANRGVMGYFQLFGCMLVPILFPLYGVIFKRPLPTAMSAMVALQVILANFMGTVLGFYEMISWWDLLMHGAFGFVGGVLAYFIITRWRGRQMNAVAFYVFIFCFVMTCGVLWEFFEYITDGIFPQNDAQVTKGLVGREAIRDTMEDLLITVAGIAVFYVLIAVDKLAKWGLTEKALADPMEKELEKKEESSLRSE